MEEKNTRQIIFYILRQSAYTLAVLIGATYLIFRISLMASVVIGEQPHVMLTMDDVEADINKEKIAQVEKELKKLNDANPKYEFLRATYEYYRGDAEGAVKSYESYLKREPEDILAMLNLASILIGRGKIDRAYELCREAYFLKPESALVNLRMGEVLIARKKYRKAMRVLGKTRNLASQLNQNERKWLINKADRLTNRLRDKGLDLSYLGWLNNMLKGNLGISTTSGRPVKEELSAKFKRTIIITMGALIFSIALAIPIGITSANNPNALLSRISTTFVYGISGIPVFLLGIIALKWFKPPIKEFSYYLSMIVCLAFGNGLMSEISKLTKEEATAVLSKDFMIAVKARNASAFKHLGKNLLIPITTIIISKLPLLLSGAIIIEIVFSYQGMGIWILDAAQNKNLPVLLPAITCLVLVVCVAKVLKDILYAVVDPRICG